MTLSQLVGDEPLPQSCIRESSYLENHVAVKHLPILSWKEAITWPTPSTQKPLTVAAEQTYSHHAYALLVEGDEWEKLSKDTVLLIDPAHTPDHRDFVIVYKEGQNIPTLKQALYDEEQMYLKPLISGYNIITFTPEHKLLGVVMEYRKQMKKVEKAST